MTSDRRLQILTRLSVGGVVTTDRLCGVCRELTEMTGAGIMIMSGDVPRGSLCTSGAVSALIEELQFSLGEGPCVDAYNLELPVGEPDLATAVGRWPGFTPAALEGGVRAIFGFPLRVGSVCLGALDLFRDRPGTLSDDQHADALVMSEVFAQAVLEMQARAPFGELAIEFEPMAKLRDVVHQAAGMVSIQLGVSVGQSLIRLRSEAFASELVLDQLAHDVVARRVRFNAATGDLVAVPYRDPEP